MKVNLFFDVWTIIVQQYFSILLHLVVTSILISKRVHSCLYLKYLCRFLFMKQNYFSNIYLLRFIQIQNVKMVSVQGVQAREVCSRSRRRDLLHLAWEFTCLRFLLTNASFPGARVLVLRQESC